MVDLVVARQRFDLKLLLRSVRAAHPFLERHIAKNL
jgi:hypothetical protein